MDLLEHARSLRDRMVDVRRDLHRHPELSFRERRTAGVVASALDALGLEVRTGVGRTGVVADLVVGDGPAVALRADMDALPIQEDADHDYGSTVPGVMHACGHDVHTAALLGTAEVLADAARRGALAGGTVRFVFQPSEEATDGEGKSGATRMVEDGAMAGVDAVVGLHVGAHLPLGKVFLTSGPAMAGAQEIEVDVRGVSAHGARPQDGVDAVLLAAQGVLAAQHAVSRRISPADTGVVTFGEIRGGTACNVIADHVRVRGTLRYFRDEVRDALRAGVRAAFGIADVLGGSASVTFKPGYPPVVNDDAVTGRVERAVARVLGREAVVRAEPMMEAEDFGILAREARGTFFWLGAGLPEPRRHHHPRFDVDEDVLPLGAALLAAAAEELLSAGR